MWQYQKKLQYPINIKNPNPKFAKIIISQYGGPDGEKMCIRDSRNTDPHKSAFYRSLQNTIDSFAVWHRRYLEALDPASDNYRNLQRVPWQPPRHFYEAVQSLSLIHI